MKNIWRIILMLGISFGFYILTRDGSETALFLAIMIYIWIENKKLKQ